MIHRTRTSTFLMWLGMLPEGADDDPDELSGADDAARSFSFLRFVPVLTTSTNKLMSLPKPASDRGVGRTGSDFARLDDIEVAGVGRPSDSCAVTG